MKILFVCTGNTCRSSMAQALAESLMKGRPDMDVVFASAGLAAFTGEPASREAAAALAEMGIDLTRHRAALLLPEDVKQAGLILTMTALQRQYVQNLDPSQTEKVFTICEFAGVDGDIPDPIGQPLEAYRSCAGRLADLIGRVLDRLGG